MKKGQAVTVLVVAGGLDHPEDGRFSGQVEPGTVGEYVGRHGKLKGWHMVKCGALFVPLSASMFEVVK